jgi:nucleotide-binding universal stress UspA family protein
MWDMEPRAVAAGGRSASTGGEGMTMGGAHDLLAPIVVGVDRAGSDAGVAYGAAEAARTGRPLDLVHVAPLVDGWLATIGGDALRVAASRAAAHVADRAEVRSRLLRGQVVEGLAHTAAGAALVVLEQLPPAHQLRPAGSVTLALGAVVDAPVFVVPADWVGRRRSIVTVGFDPGAPDGTALRTAVVQALLRHATLRVVVAGARGDVDDCLARLGADACDVAVEEVSGDPAAALRLAGLTSDLVVVGRREPTTRQSSLLGSVSRAVLRDPPCPVLLTPPGHRHSASVRADGADARVGLTG